jgi:hypothetical protein
LPTRGLRVIFANPIFPGIIGRGLGAATRGVVQRIWTELA